MDGRAALEIAKECAAAGMVRISRHAQQRMDERGARIEDVYEAIKTATRATEQDGDDLAVVVAFAGDVVVVTVF